MRKTILLLVALFISSGLFAQSSNLVIFSEQGERFLVVMNGIQQNDGPETNVKVTGLTAPNYKVKIIFDDKSLPEIDKTLYFEQGMEYGYVIKKSSKGEYVLRLFSQTPLEQLPPPPPSQKVVGYTATEHTGVVTTGISVGGISTTVTTTTATTSTTVTTTGVDMDINSGHHEEVVYVVPGYNGPYGCRYPMNQADFAQGKESISGKSFEEDKLIIAKQITGANCLLCSQIKELMELFSFEDTRLTFAKFAYRYAYDPGNYYKLNDAFDFSSSIDELNRHINGR